MSEPEKPGGGCADEVLAGRWPEDVSAAAYDDMARWALGRAADAESAAQQAYQLALHADAETDGVSFTTVTEALGADSVAMLKSSSDFVNMSAWLTACASSIRAAKTAMAAAVAGHQSIHDAPLKKTITAARGTTKTVNPAGKTQEEKDADLAKWQNRVVEAEASMESMLDAAEAAVEASPGIKAPPGVKPPELAASGVGRRDGVPGLIGAAAAPPGLGGEGTSADAAAAPATPLDPSVYAAPAAAARPPPEDLDDALFGPGGAPVAPTMLDRMNAQRQAEGKAPLASLRDSSEFMASARGLLADKGLSAQQIEQAIDGAVKLSEQPMAPHASRPEAAHHPMPGFVEGFRDGWHGTEQFVKNLFGQGDPGAPGVLESWNSFGESLTETLTNPAGVIKGEIEAFRDAPSAAYYAGEHAGAAAPLSGTALFGGEALALRNLPDPPFPGELVRPGGMPEALLHDWDPYGGLSEAEFTTRYGNVEHWDYPNSNPDFPGFPEGHVPQHANLQQGDVITRVGRDTGEYLAPDGALFTDRVLPPSQHNGEYHRYMVTGKPLPEGWEVRVGPLEPGFSQTPSPDAIQYLTRLADGSKLTVEDLLDRGILVEIDWDGKIMKRGSVG